MVAYIILGLVLGLPLLLGILLRVGTSYLFFSLLAGELLVRYFADDAELVLRLVIRNPSVAAYAQLAVLLLPVLLTALFLRHTLTKGKLFLHIVPMLLTGFVLAAFALPLLPHNLQDQVSTVQAGQQILKGSDAIIGAVIFLQLVSLWFMNRAHEGKHGKKH
jgi:hypothetical protein